MLIGTIGGQRIESVGHGDNPRQQRNLISLKAIRIAAAVESFVMKFDAWEHFRKLGNGSQKIGALCGMGLHDLKFFCIQRARLLEDAVFDADLAHVVELRGDL